MRGAKINLLPELVSLLALQLFVPSIKTNLIIINMFRSTFNSCRKQIKIGEQGWAEQLQTFYNLLQK